jgi:hypothetical protein
VEPRVILLYIDPGVGSLAFQALIATVIAVPFLLREHVSRLLAHVRGLRQRDERNDTPHV